VQSLEPFCDGHGVYDPRQRSQVYAMIDKLRIACGTFFLAISILFLNASATNYVAVLFMGTGAAVMAIAVFAVSARHATGNIKMILRAAAWFALVIACLSGWGAVEALLSR